MEPWRRLDESSPDEARRLLRTCCGSAAWVDRMLARRPFGARDALLTAARDEWFGLTRADWLEAFDHHPKIGDRRAVEGRFAGTRDPSAREQSGVEGVGEDVLDALSSGNAVYEQRFGYIFIVCATGRSAEEMLGLLRARLNNTAATELRIAAEEQSKITGIRLDRL